MSTFFDEMRKNFKDVPITEQDYISTTEFLEAAESLVKLFGKSIFTRYNPDLILTVGSDLFGSSAFGPVQSDMTGNIKVGISNYFPSQLSGLSHSLD